MTEIQDLNVVTYPPTGRTLTLPFAPETRIRLRFWYWWDKRRGLVPQYRPARVVRPGDSFITVGYIPMAYRGDGRNRHIGEPTALSNAKRICRLANEELQIRGCDW